MQQFCGNDYVKVTDGEKVYAMKVHFHMGWKVLGYDVRDARRIWAFDTDCDLIDQIQANRIAFGGDPERHLHADLEAV